MTTLERPNVLSVPQPKANPQPKLYETDESRYAGPHPWQTTLLAKWLRRQWRPYAYTRWYEQACADTTVRGLMHLRGLIDQPGPAVFIANHQSHLDTVVVNEVLPNELRPRVFYGAAQDRWFVKGKRKLQLQPWYQSLALGNFPIMRGGGKGALSYASSLLRKQQCVLLFPEGTRSMRGELGAFRHGATLLALEHNVPVYPIYLGGIERIRAKQQKDVTPGSAYVEFLQPIHFSTGSEVSAATERLAQRMQQAHERFRAGQNPSALDTATPAANSPDADVAA